MGSRGNASVITADQAIANTFARWERDRIQGASDARRNLPPQRGQSEAYWDGYRTEYNKQGAPAHG